MPKSLMHSSSFFTLNNWGLAKQMPLEARAFSAGTFLRAGEPPFSFVAACLFQEILIRAHPFVFFPLNLVFPCLLFSLRIPHSVLQLAAFIFSFSPHPHFPPRQSVNTHSSGGNLLNSHEHRFSYILERILKPLGVLCGGSFPGWLFPWLRSAFSLRGRDNSNCSTAWASRHAHIHPLVSLRCLLKDSRPLLGTADPLFMWILQSFVFFLNVRIPSSSLVGPANTV